MKTATDRSTIKPLIVPFSILLCLCLIGPGCGDAKPAADAGRDGGTDRGATATENASEPVVIRPRVYEVGADELLAARVSPRRTAEGWVRLFDGHTLFGWELSGTADWRIDDQIIVAAGGPGVMTTAMPWNDFELSLQYRAAAGSLGGVLLRTVLQPEDPAVECYQIQIGDANGATTGSLTGRQAASAERAQQPDQWKTLSAVVRDANVRVDIDGETVCEYDDPTGGLPAGRIGLAFQSGQIEFRDIQLRPIGGRSLLDADLSRWKRYPDMTGEFSVNSEGHLRVVGGKTQLETRDVFGDFVLRATYQLPTAEINSGIFFRCIPGEEMMGYECQLNDGVVDGNPLLPADCGTGGIFRRQDARVVTGETGKPNTVTLSVQGPQMAAWVNGVQVSQWTDDRDPDENPRRGRRDEAGTIIIQGHDPGTDATLREIHIIATDRAEQP